MLAVLGALFANGSITVLKFIAAVFTGSSGMMAESLHSPARFSRGLLLGEAAIPKDVEKIRQAIESHSSVNEVVELLTMHLAPKQILVNAHINLKNELTNEQIVNCISEIEKDIKKVEPKVDMIFLETSSLSENAIKAV